LQVFKNSKILISLTVQQTNQKMQSQRELCIQLIWWKKFY